MNTIHELRKSGYKVRVKHQRYLTVWNKDEQIIQHVLKPLKDLPGKDRFPRGGHTKIELTTPEGKNYEAESKCHINDNFDRKLAVKICLGRIAKKIEGY